MSAGAATAPATLPRERTGTLTQVGHLAKRSVVRTVRQPAVIVSSMVFPLFLLAINASGLAATTDLPGFPTDSYLTFFLAVTFMQGALFSTMGAGQAIAQDIQLGFFNRLQLTPLRGPALIGGQLAGTLLLGVVQATGFLAIGLGVRRRPRSRSGGSAGADRVGLPGLDRVRLGRAHDRAADR